MKEIINKIIIIDDTSKHIISNIENKRKNIDEIIEQTINNEKKEIDSNLKKQIDNNKNEYMKKLEKNIIEIENKTDTQIKKLEEDYYSKKQDLLNKMYLKIIKG